MSQEKEKKGIRGNDKRQISGLSANAQTWRVLAMNPRPRHIPEVTHALPFSSISVTNSLTSNTAAPQRQIGAATLSIFQYWANVQHDCGRKQSSPMPRLLACVGWLKLPWMIPTLEGSIG